MFSRNFWILWALRKFVRSSVVPHLSNILRRSYRAHNALLVRSYWAHLGEVRAQVALKIRDFQLKNQCDHSSRMACQGQDVSATWARYKHLKCTHHFSGCLSAIWARREHEVNTTWRDVSAKIACLILPFCHNDVSVKVNNFEVHSGISYTMPNSVCCPAYP